MNNPTIEQVAAYLDHVGLQYMATIGLDGKPKVRPMQYMVIHDGKLWFCTNSHKAIYAELQASPTLELCGSRLEDDPMQSAWIRLSGEAVFEDNATVRRLIIDKSEIVRHLYATQPDNPIFKVFYLRNVEGVMTNLGHIPGLPTLSGYDKPVTFKL